MSCILDKLYLGDINDAYNIKEKLPQVTHLLTIESKPLPDKIRDGMKYMYVNCLDLENVDILSHIPKCLNFIDEGRKEGSVMVHCFAGQSRSATIVIAYLMKVLNLSSLEAIEYAKKSRPMIGPNEGFIEQIEMFERMGNTVDIDCKVFKHYKLKLLSEKFNIESVSDIPENLLNKVPMPNETSTMYKCKKCRKSLFGQTHVLSHTPEIIGKLCNPSYFVEPMSWMKDDIQKSIAEKLTCPSCKSKIGSFNWNGESCSCGQFVIPSFRISQSKIDVMHHNNISKSNLIKNCLS